jgi:hypothetical protein
MPDMPWTDEGPFSPQKILTAIMQNRREDAEEILRHWTVSDLIILAKAAYLLNMLAVQAQVRQARTGYHAG